MNKIILIEDNNELSEQIKHYIEKYSYDVYTADSLTSAKNIIQSDFSVALLDINLPDGSGIEILKLLKENGIKVIILTVRNDEAFIVNALDNGADDFITKPFSLAILRARIDAALRDKLKISQDTICYKSFIIDVANSYIMEDDKKLDLTPREFELLSLFIQNPHRVFTRSYLLNRLWDNNNAYVNDNTLTVTIKRIREKMKGKSISTIRGIGYRLD